MRKGGEITKKILLLLLAGALTTSPRTSQRIWDEIFRLCFGKKKLLRGRVTPAIVRSRFHYLKRAKLISWQEFPDGRLKIVLTKEGEKKALTYKLDDITIKKPRHWDKKWRCIIFDIPESRRQGRDALRKKLKAMELLQIQKSVWIHPFPCEDEIDFISKTFDIDQYILYAEAKIKSDHILREWFSLA